MCTYLITVVKIIFCSVYCKTVLWSLQSADSCTEQFTIMLFWLISTAAALCGWTFLTASSRWHHCVQSSTTHSVANHWPRSALYCKCKQRGGGDDGCWDDLYCYHTSNVNAYVYVLNNATSTPSLFVMFCRPKSLGGKCQQMCKWSLSNTFWFIWTTSELSQVSTIVGC